MTEFYKPSSRRGKFQRQNIGSDVDQIRRQSETITNAIKEQAIRKAEYGNKHLAALKGIDRNQAENQNILTRIRNKKFRTGIEAIEKRKQNESDALRAQADELDKDRLLWKEFTQRGASQLGQAAEDLYRFADIIDANRRLKDFYESDKSQKFLLNKRNAVNGELSEIEKQRQLAFQKGDFKEGRAYTGLFGESIDAYADGMANKIIKEIKLYESGFKNFLNRVDENGTPILKVNKDTVQGLWEDHAIEIMRHYGINPNTAGGYKIFQAFQKIGVTEAKAEFDRVQFEIDDRKLNKDLDLILESPLEQLTNLNIESAVNSIMYGISRDDRNNQYIYPDDKTNRHIDGFQGLVKLLTNRGYFDNETTREERIDFFLNYRSWDKGTTEPGKLSLSERHPLFEEEIRKTIDNHISSKFQYRDTEQKVKDQDRIVSLAEEQENGKYDVNSWEDYTTDKNGEQVEVLGRKSFFAVISQENEKVRSWFNENVFYYDPRSQTEFATHNALLRSHKEGDFAEFTKLYSLIPKSKRAAYQPLFKDLESLSLTNWEDGQASIKNWAKTLILNNNKGQAWPDVGGFNSRLTPTAVDIQGILKQGVIYHFGLLDSIENPQTRLEEAKKIVEDEFTSGRGVYRVIDDGKGSIKWPALEGSQTTTEKSVEEVEALVNTGGYYIEGLGNVEAKYSKDITGLNYFLDTHQRENFSILSEGDIATAVRAIQDGTYDTTVQQFPARTYLSKTFNVTEKQLMEAIFKLAGFEKVRYPTQPEDALAYNLKKSFPKYNYVNPSKRNLTGRMLYYYSLQQEQY